ncbi:hypothetical protein BJV77DRAFT_1005367 [Russula vinacea]|nr:hypothetical protein BJV77DRAFT_1005367 [Russula vinacea]
MSSLSAELRYYFFDTPLRGLLQLFLAVVTHFSHGFSGYAEDPVIISPSRSSHVLESSLIRCSISTSLLDPTARAACRISSLNLSIVHRVAPGV